MVTHIKNVARIYLRVSTKQQELKRQEDIVHTAKTAGYYIAGIYREKASGARADRPELLRLIADLQEGEVVIAEKIDRISRLPLAEAERLVEAIKSTGAKLAIPGIVDLSELTQTSQGVTKIVLEAVQNMLLKIALQVTHEEYEVRRERQKQGIALAKAEGRYKGRRARVNLHERIITLRQAGQSIASTAILVACSISQVKRIWAKYQKDTKELRQN